ncbi:MAG: ribonuclease hii [Akkermansiaceae bacterium]|nr:ribonuclease hii [Akkermansiaceae bacterium]
MPDLEFESVFHARGLLMIAGVDEAGRGPLAGPVAAAAVVLPPGFCCEGLDDSKKVPARRREQLYDYITTHTAVLWAVSFVHEEEIDRINILRATHKAMARAVKSLRVAVDHCLIDGLRVPKFKWPHDGIVGGDGKSLSIAAASIIAKVSRDRRMHAFAREFPQYGFERHMGYGTKEHLAALRQHGPCRIHRRSFQPVAQLQLPLDET